MSEQTESQAAFPPLGGKRLYLRAVRPDDLEFLYAMFTDEQMTFQWRLRGATPNPENFAAGLWQATLVQFIVVRRSDDMRLGLISAYNVDLRSGYAYIALAFAPPFQKGIYSHDANLLFVNYLFRGWNFRKLYGESGEKSMASAMGGNEKYFRIEGCLKEHEYFDGKYWDSYTVALYRSDWEQLIAERLPGVLGISDEIDGEVERVPASEDIPAIATP